MADLQRGLGVLAASGRVLLVALMSITAPNPTFALRHLYPRQQPFLAHLSFASLCTEFRRPPVCRPSAHDDVTTHGGLRGSHSAPAPSKPHTSMQPATCTLHRGDESLPVLYIMLYCIGIVRGYPHVPPYNTMLCDYHTYPPCTLLGIIV